MQTTKKQWRLIGVVAAIAALAGVYYVKTRESVLPRQVISSVDSSATSSAAAPSTASSTSTGTSKFPINASDSISSWTFKGAYTGNSTLIAQADADIKMLTGLLGAGKYDDYDLYNGIANDYSLKGDGASAYQYYNHSIAIHPTKGLAYVNLAHLFDLMGAKYSAADAYTKAVTVEGGTLEYHIERLNFLTRVFPADTARITAAFAAVSRQFGDTAQILAIEADWLTGQKRYVDAIGAWEKAKMLSPGQDTSAIDAAIARLKAKQ